MNKSAVEEVDGQCESRSQREGTVGGGHHHILIPTLK